MFVKVCGITNLEDAQFAIEAGASALGFIFAKSKRQLTPVTAAAIIAGLPKQVEKIGVFSNEEKETVCRIARFSGLTGVQLHGEEPPEYCADLGHNFKVIKTVKIDPEGNILSGMNYPTWKFLLDTQLLGQSGGTGKTFNWESLKQFDLDQILVAGGLNPENVGQLLARFQPFGLDLCSGVEAFPGKKDPEKVRRFFEVVSSMINK